MAKTLTEMAVDIITAQLSHRDMSPDEIAEGLRNTFGVLKTLREIEVRREFSAAEIETYPYKTTALANEGLGFIVPKASPRDFAGTEDKGPLPSAGFMEAMDSIQDEKIICLECGRDFKQISHTHLKGHGLTPKGYRKKHRLPAKQPLTARSLSERRKQKAKEIGLGSRLKSLREAKQRI